MVDLGKVREAVRDAIGGNTDQLLDLSDEEQLVALDACRGVGTSEGRAENQKIVRAAIDLRLESRRAEQAAALVEATDALSESIRGAARVFVQNAKVLAEERAAASASEARRNRLTQILIGTLSVLALLGATWLGVYLERGRGQTERNPDVGGAPTEAISPIPEERSDRSSRQLRKPGSEARSHSGFQAHSPPSGDLI